jgi:hypothetical protein
MMAQRVEVGAYPVTLAVIDETKSWGITAVGNVLASVVDIRLECKQLDGTWKTFMWASGDTPAAVPGAGNLRFASSLASGIFVKNIGTITGKLFCRLKDDVGTVLFERWSDQNVDPSLSWIFPQYDTKEVFTFDMPPRNYSIIVEAGH